MEFLNSTWNLLTTQNELISKIIITPLTFIEVTLYFLVFTQVLSIKYNNKQRNVYILIFSSISIILSLFFPVMLRTIINIFICPVCLILVFKISMLKAILAEFVPLILVALIETLVAKLLFIFFCIPYEQAFTIPIYRFCILLFILTLFYILFLLIKKSNISISSFENLDNKNKTILIINAIIGLITIIIQFYLSSFYNESLPLIITILSLLTLTAFFSINIFSLTSIIKLKDTKQCLEESQLYNKTLQILYDNVSSFRHDFSNIVSAIGGYITAEDMDGVKKYYSQLLIDCQRTNNLTSLNPELIDNPAIYNVLANKYHLADKKGIKIELSIFCKFNVLNIKIYELTRILGILLDNALEASGESEIKNINLIIRDEPNQNRKVLVLENTYTNKDVNTNKIYEKGFSTKPGNTGLGLWQVRQILMKNNNLNLFTSKNDDYFIQQLEIYNKSNLISSMT